MKLIHYNNKFLLKVIEGLGKLIEDMQIDFKIHAYGFGDSFTKDRRVFKLSVQKFSYTYK